MLLLTWVAWFKTSHAFMAFVLQSFTLYLRVYLFWKSYCLNWSFFPGVLLHFSFNPMLDIRMVLRYKSHLKLGFIPRLKGLLVSGYFDAMLKFMYIAEKLHSKKNPLWWQMATHLIIVITVICHEIVYMRMEGYAPR